MCCLLRPLWFTPGAARGTLAGMDGKDVTEPELTEAQQMGRLIAAAAKEKEWGPTELARQMDVSVGTARAWMSGAWMPRAKQMRKLQDKLDVDFGQIDDIPYQRRAEITRELTEIRDKIDVVLRLL